LNTGTIGVCKCLRISPLMYANFCSDRVLYSPDHLSKLGDEATRANSSLSREDRMGLVSDAFVLGRAGYGETSAALDLMKKLRNDRDYLVWARMGNAVSDLIDVWWDEPDAVREGLKAFGRSLFGPLVEKLGFDASPNDTPDVVHWRSIAVANSAMANDPKTLEEIKHRFSLLVESNDASQIPGDLQRQIFIHAVRTGGVPEWEKALDVYRNPQTPSQKMAAIQSMCRAQDPALLRRTLDMILTEGVKTQDYISFFVGFAANPSSRRQIWAFLQDHLDVLTKKLDGGFLLGDLVQVSFDSLTSFEDGKTVEEFFKEKDTSKFAQLIAQGLDAIRSKATWLERSRDEVRKWLETNGYV